MAETRDLVPELLIAIRDEMRGMREEQRGTNERLGRVEGELHSSNERLDRVEVGLRETRDELRTLGRRRCDALHRDAFWHAYVRIPSVPGAGHRDAANGERPEA